MPLADRRSGILLHPTALPGPHGHGDLGEAAHRFLDWLQRAGQRLWQVLPLQPAGPGESPYMSPSAFAGDPALVALVPLMRAGWLEPAELRPGAPGLPPAPGGVEDAAGGGTEDAAAASRCDFARARPWRAALLERAAARFAERASADERQRLDAWCARQAGWLDDWALFAALKAAHGGAPWWDWPAPLKQRRQQALAEARAAHAAALHAARFAQWCFALQWGALRHAAQARGIALVGDLPIFVAHDSADCWARPDLYELDADGQPTAVAGVPPDDLGPDGQRWGNPLYRWERMAADGYGWWVQRMARALELVDAVRLDHFIGFVRHWVIPAAEPGARIGHWAPGPGRALFDAMAAALAPAGAAEAAAAQPGGRLPVVAEDLGLVTPEVEALRRELGLPGMRILQFAFGGDGGHGFLPHNCPPDSVLYTGTHDNDTVQGWWAQAPARERAYCAHVLRLAPGSAAQELHWAMVQAACQSPARWAVFPLQDVLGLPGSERVNHPGTLGGDNWRWRVDAAALTDAVAARLAGIAAGSGRAPIGLLPLPRVTAPQP